MKARIPFKNSVSKKRLAAAEEFIHSELRKGKQEEITRTLKIIAFSLYMFLGFGEKRVKQFLDDLSKLMNECDELFWDRVDDVLFERLHLDDYFNRENYEEREELLK